MQFTHWRFPRQLAAACALTALAAFAAHADGLGNLAAFIQNAHDGRAAFTQTVTSPPRQDGVVNEKKSSGAFEFRRPGKFRFDYRKPFEQTIVADGKTLWFYDVDLNQVTARGQDQVLAQTPAAVVAAATDMQALERDFTLENEPDRDGMQWVRATPKVSGGQIERIAIGFKSGKLAALDILDAFGQQSQLRFSNVEINVDLPGNIFEFQVPKGADVLRDPAN